MTEMRLPIALAIIVIIGTIIYCDHARTSCEAKSGVIVRGIFGFECVDKKQ